MPVPVQSLCWMSRASKLKGFSALRKKIEQAGYTLEQLKLGDEVSADWCVKNIPPTAKGILFVDEDPAEVLEFCTVLQTTPHCFLSVYYAYTDPKRLADWEKCSPSGLADIFALSESATQMRMRFEMREWEQRERTSIYKNFQEQGLQLAKTDTILKQREEFLSVCAHDLRSPIGLIQTCLSMVLKADKATRQLGTAHADLLERALRQSGYALSLVKDLLDVTSLDQGLKPIYSMIRLHELVNEFYIDFGLQAEQKNIKFHYSNPITEWKVLADSERIKQLLGNLFANALKFTEPGKNIYLHVAPFQGRRKQDPAHPMIVISLRDEGRGIPQSEMQKIFDRFTQIKENTREGGRGLGLTVAKQISTLHDGNIWVESEEGKGSTFFVLFPHAISRLLCPPKNGKYRKILVAEPNLEKRKTVYGKLTEWGHEVLFAGDGVEAITLLFHHWPDAVILTPDLTKISTPDVANLLKSEPRINDIPLVLVTPSDPNTTRATAGILADAAIPATFTQDQWHAILAACRKRAA